MCVCVCVCINRVYKHAVDQFVVYDRNKRQRLVGISKLLVEYTITQLYIVVIIMVKCFARGCVPAAVLLTETMSYEYV